MLIRTNDVDLTTLSRRPDINELADLEIAKRGRPILIFSVLCSILILFYTSVINHRPITTVLLFSVVLLSAAGRFLLNQKYKSNLVQSKEIWRIHTAVLDILFSLAWCLIAILIMGVEGIFAPRALSGHAISAGLSLFAVRAYSPRPKIAVLNCLLLSLPIVAYIGSSPEPEGIRTAIFICVYQGIMLLLLKSESKGFRDNAELITQINVLFQFSGEGVLIVQNGKICDANDSALLVFQRNRIEILGKSLQELGLLRIDSEIGYCIYLHLGDGSVITVEVISGKCQFKGREAFTVRLRNLTEKKNLIATKQNLQRELEETLRQRTQFIASVSHEIRTPLHGIIATTDLLSNSNLDSEQAKLISLISKSSAILLNLIEDILNFTKNEVAKFSTSKSIFNPAKLFQDVTDSLQPIAFKKGLKVELVLSDTDSFSIKGDSVRISQVLFNLISNAIKFSVNGSIEVKCTIGKDMLGHDIMTFSVKDTGIGIKATDLENLFKPFSKIESSKVTNPNGAGLGLSITKSLIGIMNGKIEIKSEYGKGTEISCIIPIELINEPVPEISSQSAGTAVAIASDQQALPRLKVLAIEDDEINQFVLMAMAERLNFNLVLTASPSQTFQKCKTETFDIILMDLQLPEMDGFEATQQLRKMGVSCPIVATSANVGLYSEEQLIASGFTDRTEKPYKMHDLENILIRIFRNATGRDKLSTVHTTD